jgi:hypothetical protein
MSLKDFIIATEVVAFRGGSIELRGLALNDVTALIRNHLADLNRLFDMYDDEETRASALAEAARFALTLVQESPAVVAKMIALCSDEPEHEATAARLPIPVQVEAVRKIIELTFEEAGGAKKFLDSVTSLVKGIMPQSLTP